MRLGFSTVQAVLWAVKLSDRGDFSQYLRLLSIDFGTKTPNDRFLESWRIWSTQSKLFEGTPYLASLDWSRLRRPSQISPMRVPPS